MAYKTIVIGYAPKAKAMAAEIERITNEKRRPILPIPLSSDRLWEFSHVTPITVLFGRYKARMVWRATMPDTGCRFIWIMVMTARFSLAEVPEKSPSTVLSGASAIGETGPPST